MTAAVLRSSPNLAVPPTQNTAPVYEFNCLYTHDLRRKQKRWQDGFLRYHTFNKRVMVYDIPRNFLGDLHWTSRDDLQEGDEMTLEKGGIMVQVSERIGTIQTDLSDLLQRKDKTPARNTATSRTLMRHGTPHAAAPNFTPRTPEATSTTPMKHKSLNTLLGRSRRPIGKASLPTESPYEARNRDLQIAEAREERERKRRRLESPAQTTPKVAEHRNQIPVQQRVDLAAKDQACQVIDLSSDTEDISAARAASHAIDAELLATSSPPRSVITPAPRHLNPNRFLPVDRQPAAAKIPVVESPSAKIPERVKKPADPPARAPAPVFMQPVQEVTSLRLARAKKAAEISADDGDIQRSATFATGSDPQARGKSLKLIGATPRKMLVFQSQRSRPSSTEREREAGGTPLEKASSTRRAGNSDAAKEAATHNVNQTARKPGTEQAPEESVFQRRMQERLARLEKKNKRTGLQRSSSDLTEQRPAAEKATNSTGLRKTTSVVMSRLDSPEDLSLADFQFSDITPVDFDDPIIDDSAAQPPTKTSKEPLGLVTKPQGRGSSTITARSFKPLTVKPVSVPAPVLATKPAQVVAVEKKKDEDIGPWSKEAFDLMDWRPPNMQATSKTA
ncbi:hypothetical protein E4T39_01417 [Aureobasidium subglaciale]|nr:hypothetical protein E4T39_01417 [Aureobasidium subglaciale]